MNQYVLTVTLSELPWLRNDAAGHTRQTHSRVKTDKKDDEAKRQICARKVQARVDTNESKKAKKKYILLQDIIYNGKGTTRQVDRCTESYTYREEKTNVHQSRNEYT